MKKFIERILVKRKVCNCEEKPVLKWMRSKRTREKTIREAYIYMTPVLRICKPRIKEHWRRLASLPLLGISSPFQAGQTVGKEAIVSWLLHLPCVPATHYPVFNQTIPNIDSSLSKISEFSVFFLSICGKVEKVYDADK